MKKLQNSLYITKQDVYVHKARETIVIEKDKKKLMQIPAHSLMGLYCFGRVALSPYVVGFCGEKGINLSLFTEYGRFLGRFQGAQTGNVLLRRAQYRLSDKSPIEIARVVVGAKINNTRQILQRRLRNHGANDQIKKAADQLKVCLRQAKNADTVSVLMGIEGDAAAKYFAVFKHLIQDGAREEFPFNGRNRRPPKDPVNAMLSFLYSIIGKDISAALQGVGLDPQVGFLHADRPGRDSLAQDLLEEFRAWWADRLVLSLMNRKQVRAKDFVVEVSGAVRMTDDTRKVLLTALQQRKQETVRHPFLNEDVPIGLLPHVQALLLARHLRGDLECYPPFIPR